MIPIESAYYSVIIPVIIVYTLALLLLALSPARKVESVDQRSLPTVSLVVPTYNEASVIRRKLQNLLELNYPRERLQVVVVDSASTDDTKTIVKKFAAEHHSELKLNLIEQETRHGKGEAINEVLRNVSSEIFALTDADVTFPADSVLKLVKGFRQPDIGAVSGVEVPVGEHSLLTALEVDYRKIYTAVRMAETNSDTPFMCESELSAYRRDILEPVPPNSMCDDIELTVGIRKKGYRAAYDANSVFYETEAGTFASKLRHKLRRGMANQHALIRNANVMFNRRFGRYGSLVFPFEFFVHVISPILLTLSGLFFLTLALTAPRSALFAIVATTVLSIPASVILNMLLRRYRGTEVSNLVGSGSWILGALAFLGFQIVLLFSLFKLLIRGPQLNWKQISETRVPVAVEVAS